MRGAAEDAPLAVGTLQPLPTSASDAGTRSSPGKSQAAARASPLNYVEKQGECRPRGLLLLLFPSPRETASPTPEDARLSARLPLMRRGFVSGPPHHQCKLEDEISTLRQVLADKEKHLMEIKHKLGVNVMNELKQNFSKSWYDVQTHSAYKKTQETLSQAGQKATAAITNVGSAIGKKLGDMRSHSIGYSIRHSMSMPAMRNTPTFKSFEERLDSTVSTLKTKVGGASNVGASFEEVLNSTAHASAQSCSVAGTQLPEDEEDIQC
ncbi:hypothetical protein NDU88_006056 [Pleurodeles waltl]|uniref:Tumor protein D53 n=1 Tax=Pleurodeles waltl TaxID=8319 RepID=A0AAV7RP72_PLEWA|nr:hypothetical protein NDU88_006056 [Pleurodeles waltl]